MVLLQRQPLHQETNVTTPSASLAALVLAMVAKAIVKRTKMGLAQVVGQKLRPTGPLQLNHHAITAASLVSQTTNFRARRVGVPSLCPLHSGGQNLSRSSRLLLHSVSLVSPAFAKVARVTAKRPKMALVQVVGQLPAQLAHTHHPATGEASNVWRMMA
jgi:hypothetical protein